MNGLLPNLLYHFLLSLSLGTAAFTWIADPKLTGAGFIRLIVGHGVVFLAIALLSEFVFLGMPQVFWLVLTLVALAIMGIQWRKHPDGKTPVMWMLFALQIICTLLLFASEAQTAKAYSFLLSSALFLGLTHYSMLLGHYYLVVPKLTEKPLLVCMRLLWALFAVKLFVSAVGTWQAESYLAEGTMLGDGYLFNWLVISMRWLWGYGALAVLSWFAWRLCRMRSIQSATGVLYIMVFFVFIGELLSVYLFMKHGLII